VDAKTKLPRASSPSVGFGVLALQIESISCRNPLYFVTVTCEALVTIYTYTNGFSLVQRARLAKHVFCSRNMDLQDSLTMLEKDNNSD
jgi:hypothetical protein